MMAGSMRTRTSVQIARAVPSLARTIPGACVRPAGRIPSRDGRPSSMPPSRPMQLRLIALVVWAASDMVAVPGGPFLYGSDDGDLDERPRRRAATAGFLIDRTEVTRAAYARCVGAGACAPAASYPEQ